MPQEGHRLPSARLICYGAAMRRILLAICLTVPSTVWAECPKGTEQSVNAAGVPNCITVVPRATPAAPAPPQTCPPGSSANSVFNGETVCRRIDTGREFFNPSVSCPIGTFPGYDASGSRACQR